MTKDEIKTKLLEGLTSSQCAAVKSEKRRLLVVAGAGSGKTEVMVRRVAWWVGVEDVPKDRIVAFTFTDRAAEEMKLRIRRWLNEIAPGQEDAALGGMYIGTIHGFCMAKLREHWPDKYHNYDILDEGARISLIQRSFSNVLALKNLQDALAAEKDSDWQGQYDTIDTFLKAYDLLHDNGRFDVCLPSEVAPTTLGEVEREWCKRAKLETRVGNKESSKSFAESAARYYAYLHCRRFLDFNASQSEIVRRLENEGSTDDLQNVHLVVDELQDVNPVQKKLIDLLVGDEGHLTAVGDHRQAIYAWRGGHVEIIAELWEQLKESDDSEVVDLRENFRSTPQIIELANQWAKKIGGVGEMSAEDMIPGGDVHSELKSHIAMLKFPDSREREAAWIAKAIRELVPLSRKEESASHNKRATGKLRGITLSDIAILIRSSTDARTYMRALSKAHIDAVVRAGPDLFSQPEVLLFISALAITAGETSFMGNPNNYNSLPYRIKNALGIEMPKGKSLTPEETFSRAAEAIRGDYLSLSNETQGRLFHAARAICKRIAEGRLRKSEASDFRDSDLRSFLTEGGHELRRVFPQRIFHMLLGEGQVELWDKDTDSGRKAMFHLGALSGLITGIETPGWTSKRGYIWQIRGLCQYGTRQGRVEEQALMVRPDAVSVCTIHAAKGLEFAAVFLADVNARRFPSSRAKVRVSVPLDGEIVEEVRVESLSDNKNNDDERRLMYVALTRAERFLFITSNSDQTSQFFKELTTMVKGTGGLVDVSPEEVLQDLHRSPKEYLSSTRLATSFSDLRYYFECPHDFYLRKVLGFSPTIDQAFGYGRGVHNLMREINSNPKKWAALADRPEILREEIDRLIEKGLFYLRYTTGEPAKNMMRKGAHVVADYVRRYADELARLEFEPEKPFETVIGFLGERGEQTDGALVSGAIDVLRMDDPPSVSIIDFKSGHAESDSHIQLSKEQMRRQIGIYAIAAKKELEYRPEKGLVRYLDAKGEDESDKLEVKLDDNTIEEVRQAVSEAVTDIRDRKFTAGPKDKGRCKKCDFLAFCGKDEAVRSKEQKD